MSEPTVKVPKWMEVAYDALEAQSAEERRQRADIELGNAIRLEEALRRILGDAAEELLPAGGLKENKATWGNYTFKFKPMFGEKRTGILLTRRCPEIPDCPDLEAPAPIYDAVQLAQALEVLDSDFAAVAYSVVEDQILAAKPVAARELSDDDSWTVKSIEQMLVDFKAGNDLDAEAQYVFATAKFVFNVPF